MEYSVVYFLLSTIFSDGKGSVLVSPSSISSAHEDWTWVPMIASLNSVEKLEERKSGFDVHVVVEFFNEGEVAGLTAKSIKDWETEKL